MASSFWHDQLACRSADSLAALASAALRTRTYLDGHAYSPADAAVAAALAPLAPRLSCARLQRWLASCAAHAPPPAAGVEARVARLEALAGAVQCSVREPLAPEAARVRLALAALAGSALLEVPANYYALKLRERAQLLRAPVGALCKTLVFENAAGAAVGDAAAPLAAQRYVAVVLQYTHKLNLAALAKVVGGGALALAKEGPALTGFGFNGLTPLGSLTPLPVIVARGAVECGSHFIWLGGGREDIKARVFLRPLLALVGVAVAGVSEPRAEGDWEGE